MLQLLIFWFNRPVTYVLVIIAFVIIFLNIKINVFFDSSGAAGGMSGRKQFAVIKIGVGFGKFFAPVFDTEKKISGTKKVKKSKHRPARSNKNFLSFGPIYNILFMYENIPLKFLKGIRIKNFYMRIDKRIEDAALNAIITGILYAVAANLSLLLSCLFKFSSLEEAEERIYIHVDNSMVSSGAGFWGALGGSNINDNERIKIAGNCIFLVGIAHIIHIAVRTAVNFFRERCRKNEFTYKFTSN